MKRLAISFRWSWALSSMVALSLPGAPLLAQASVDSTLREWMPFAAPGSRDEDYLRYLQIAGLTAQYPWSSRGFTPGETRRMSVPVDAHPRTGRWPFSTRRWSFTALPLSAGAIVNSAFPYGGNDGAIWAGRGATGYVGAGGVLRSGFLTAVVAPVAFHAQNASFTLFDEAQSGRARFADPVYGDAIDYPQRFGDERYGRVDPGQSSLLVEMGPVSAGASSANLVWGPLTEYPFVLSANAAGFPHAFAGTSSPLNVFVGRLHGRVIWGALEQSEYSPVTGPARFHSLSEPGTRRFATGVVAVFLPRGMRGLELGLSRFFHAPWPREGLPRSYAWKALSNLTKSSLADTPGFPDEQGGGDNQINAAFARWTFPSARLEVYGEYGREDHAYDVRDLLQEPDHSRSYGFGVRRVLALSPTRLDGLRFELISFQAPHLLRTGRGEGGIYSHAILRQGHTHRGQLLGAPVGAGEAAGSVLAWDRYTRRGTTTLAVRRTLRRESGTFYSDGQFDTRAIDVQYALESDYSRRFGRVEIGLGLDLVRELNRDFRRDAWNVGARATARYSLEAPEPRIR